MRRDSAPLPGDEMPIIATSRIGNTKRTPEIETHFEKLMLQKNL
jgi:hypothetical protein